MDCQTNEVARKLKEAQELLIDIGAKNRLLNYKPTKKRTIPVSGYAPAELYRQAIIDQGIIRFLPRDQVAASMGNSRDASDEPRELKLHTEFTQQELLARLEMVAKPHKHFLRVIIANPSSKKAMKILI